MKVDFSSEFVKSVPGSVYWVKFGVFWAGNSNGYLCCYGYVFSWDWWSVFRRQFNELLKFNSVGVFVCWGSWSNGSASFFGFNRRWSDGSDECFERWAGNSGGWFRV